MPALGFSVQGEKLPEEMGACGTMRHLSKLCRGARICSQQEITRYSRGSVRELQWGTCCGAIGTLSLPVPK